MGNCRDCNIKLWTWQSKRFSLADINQKVESLKNSFYTTNKNPAFDTEKHQEAYKKIFREKGDQLIWCFTYYNDAICLGSIEEFEKKQDRILWEIVVPENKVHWHCPVAWNYLRTGELEIRGLLNDILTSPLPDGASEDIQKDFKSFWSNKNEDEINKLMFLNKSVYLGPDNKKHACSGAIVIHPIIKDGGLITKNPLKIGKWWEKCKKFRPLINESYSYARKLIKLKPCLNCSGRKCQFETQTENMV